MNNQDYIRAGVELADGFQLADEGVFFSLPYGGFVPPVKNCPQQYLDALAAQLVRQVDTVAGIEFDVTSRSSSMWSPVEDEFGNCKIGDDRTMNTIKAIVNSRVLEL